jgi:superfamily II DNA or RNA helicase
VYVLRDYQARDVERIRAEFGAGRRCVCYQAPTGSGKTVLFAYIIYHAAVTLGHRVYVLAHRDEIVQQISRALELLEVPHAVIAAGYPLERQAHVQICSVATLVRRMHLLDPAPDFFVVDECHHSVAGTWSKILAACPQTKILGCTATPERLDGKGLEDIYQSLVIGPSISELVEKGWLSKFVTYAPAKKPDLSHVHTVAGDYNVRELSGIMSKTVVIQAAVDEYVKRCAGVPAIVFAVDIGHSQLVTNAFLQAGFRAAHVDGDTPRELRRQLIDSLGNGQTQVLSNCGLISEGLDVPVVAAAILLRPTQSLALYLQQVGRGLRPSPTKERTIILDHAACCHEHGLADSERAWSLKGRPKKKAADGPLVRVCPQCGAVNPLAAFQCVECGYQLREPINYDEVGGELVEMTKDTVEAKTLEELAAMSYSACVRWAGTNRMRLEQVRLARNYKKGWIWHQLQGH